MSTKDILFSIFITAVAVSYAWGMRGCVIGGEKGAMLPGTLLGLFLAKFSGIPAISENTLIFSAAGCLAMGYGGFEPYAQTMEMVLSPGSDIYNPKRGYTGLMLKGANWFGICGILVGLAFSAAASRIYKPYEILILFAAIPFIQALGIKLFNKPYDKANGIFPKIYFSRNSREEWGGNLLTLIAAMIFTAVKGDWFSLSFGVAGILSGAIGWAISIWLYYITIHPLKNGKYIFSKAQTSGFIDNWKIMEFALGFVGGGGLAAYFFFCAHKVKIISETINQNKFWNSSIIAWLIFAVAVLFAIQYFIKPLQKSRLFELSERAVYFSFTLCIVILGNTQSAKLTAFLLILWVVTEKSVFDREAEKPPRAVKAIYLLIFALAIILEILFEISNSILLTMLLYTFYYIFADIICVMFRPRKANEKSFFSKFKPCILTYIWFAVLSVFIMFFIV